MLAKFVQQLKLGYLTRKKIGQQKFVLHQVLAMLVVSWAGISLWGGAGLLQGTGWGEMTKFMK